MMAAKGLLIRRGWNTSQRIIVLIVCWSMAISSSAQEAVTVPNERQKWALILIGLPGDQDYAVTFQETADQIQSWLVGPLQFHEDHVIRLPQRLADHEGPDVNLSADGIRTVLSDVNSKLNPDDSLWIFTIGHGNFDGKWAWFHLEGRDPSSEEFGRWMADVKCREQLIWLMHSSSGWFVKPLSRPGRIVIAATAADEEANETEFPYALAKITQQKPEVLDTNHDGAVSVSEIFTAVVDEVLRRFKSDNRLPTEHAQIDDDGDGVGTEVAELSISDDSPVDQEKPAKLKKTDGEFARKTLVPYGVVKADNSTPTDPK